MKYKIHPHTDSNKTTVYNVRVFDVSGMLAQQWFYDLKDVALWLAKWYPTAEEEKN